jgi:dCMP deaminase
MTRPDWDLWFLRQAFVVAQRGSCLRKQVGCVVVSDDDHVVLSQGYNGAPRGQPDCLTAGCELEEINGKPSCVRTLHAESNALDRLIRWPGSKTMYVTVIPCHRCALRIVQNGEIRRVVYHEFYRSQSSDKTTLLFGLSRPTISLELLDVPRERVQGSFGQEG